MNRTTARSAPVRVPLLASIAAALAAIALSGSDARAQASSPTVQTSKLAFQS